MRGYSMLLKRRMINFSLIVILVLLTGCNINNINSEFLNNTYLELLKKQEIDMELYIDYDSLTEEEYDKILNRERFNIKEICFDTEGNLWCYSQPSDGCSRINIYDVNGTEYEYQHLYTTNGGDESYEWYTKIINNQDTEYEDEEIIKIFNKFNNMEVDTARALRLMTKNKKTITEYEEKQFIYNPNVVFFGKYHQSLYTEPIEWLVLYKDDSKALLLSRYILEWEPIDSKNIGDWNNSELNKFLNNDFYNKAFSNKEKNAIIGNINNDKVSLMTNKDVEKFFNDIQELKAVASIDVLLKIRDKEYSSISFSLNEKSTLDYWIKPFDNMNEICEYVDLNGNVSFSNIENFKGVRPVIWVSLK